MINRLFGNYLVKAGKLSSTQLEAAFEEQKKARVKLGLIAVSEKLMTPEQAKKVNRKQAMLDKRFGDIAVDMGYLTEEQVTRLLGLQGNPYLTFAQAISDLGFMSISEIEKALGDYQKENGFTLTDMEALKSGDSDRIVPLFMTPDADDLMIEHISIAVRTMIRLVDSDIYIGNATNLSTVKAFGYALQTLDGDTKASLGFTGIEDSLLEIANPFAGEEFTTVDADALDSVAEFINCVNGMFATKVASRVNIDMLPPQYKAEDVIFNANNICVLPIYIKGKKVNLLATFGEALDV